jgi:hypothetical protein
MGYNKKYYLCNEEKSCMVTIIKKGSTQRRINQALKKLRTTKGLDAFKFCGSIHLQEDPLSIQKKMRNEWR